MGYKLQITLFLMSYNRENLCRKYSFGVAHIVCEVVLCTRENSSNKTFTISHQINMRLTEI